MPTPEETRRVQRVSVKIPVTIRVDPSMAHEFALAQKEVQTFIVDMSANGCGIMSGVYIPEGVLLNIEFDKSFVSPGEPKDANKIKVTGEVVSSRMTGGQYRLGILIKDIKDEDKNVIMKFIGIT